MAIAEYTAAMNVAFSQSELPVRLRFDKPMTDEEILRFCAANDSLRVEQEPNGELIVMSPAGGGGSSKNGHITYQLFRWVEETSSGIAFDSSGGFRLCDGSLRSPDAAWANWDQWNALSAEQQERFLPFCPEFIIELRSPSDSLSELREKMQHWISNGCKLAWLIDPERKTVEIYRPDCEAEVQEGHSAVYGEGPVSGFVLELGKIWS